MLKLRCTACGAVLDAENSAAGHNLACECGKTYVLPAAPSAGDVRICLNCNSVCAVNTYECPNCHWNFRLNHVEEPDEPTRWERFAPILKRLIPVLFLAIAYLLVYSWLSASAIGVSAKTPLGIIKDGKFNGTEFTVENKNDDVVLYRAKPRGKNALPENIQLIATPNGKILSIHGAYAVMIVGSSPGKGFFDSLCKELKLPAKVQEKAESVSDGFRNHVLIRRTHDAPGFQFEETKDATPSPVLKDSGEYTFRLK